MIPRTFMAFSVCSLLVSCGPRTPEVSHVAVVGSGAKPSDFGAWQNTVAITQFGHLQCTGTLITQNLVVTAAHCLEEGSNHVATLKVHIGQGVDGGRFDGERRIVKARRHPDSRRGNIWGSADIAYLVLAEPAGVPLLPVASTPVQLKEMIEPGNASMIVGFGVFNTGTRRLGTKNEVETPVKFATAQEVFLGDSQGDACNGDSGGPVFGKGSDGSWYFFGVTSRGPSPCASDLYPGAFSLVAPHLCWLEQDSGINLGEDGNRLCPSGRVASASAPVSLEGLCKSDDTSPGARRTINRLQAIFAAARAGPRVEGAEGCEDLVAWAKTQRHLNLSQSMLTDLSPLAFFPALESLDLEDNSVTDLASLRGLTNLTLLRTAWNDIQDYAPVAAIIGRSGKVLGRDLQNSHWLPRRDTDFLKSCLAVEAGTLADLDLKAATLAIKRAACLGSECNCYTASDDMQKARELNLSDAPQLKTLTPLRGMNSIQYLKLPAGTVAEPSILSSLENLRQLGNQAWSN